MKALPSWRNCAGWLQICLSRKRVARIRPSALDALRRVQLLRNVLDDGLVEGRLLLRERAVHLLLDFVRQIGDDALVGLDAAQDEGLHQFLQGHCGCAIVVPLDGHLKGPAELRLFPQIAGIEEVEDGPEIAQPVLYGRARERQPMSRLQPEDRPRLRRLWILEVLRLIHHDAAPAHTSEEFLVQPRQREGGQHHIDGVTGCAEGSACPCAARCPDGPA